MSTAAMPSGFTSLLSPRGREEARRNNKSGSSLIEPGHAHSAHSYLSVYPLSLLVMTCQGCICSMDNREHPPLTKKQSRALQLALFCFYSRSSGSSVTTPLPSPPPKHRDEGDSRGQHCPEEKKARPQGLSLPRANPPPPIALKNSEVADQQPSRGERVRDEG